jgi:hypothetical protein
MRVWVRRNAAGDRVTGLRATRKLTDRKATSGYRSLRHPSLIMALAPVTPDVSSEPWGRTTQNASF